MNSQLYIPKRIKVGFQKRDDTYTKKLAYVIYFDDAGVLRKEKSWEGWRDKKIEPEEFENKPQSGLILNKSISRYKWSHFGTNRSYIRVYDPRGIEFEISPENLIGILMNSDCSKRAFSGEYVYAWSGTELVLLPCSCEEYEKALQYTKLQGQKIGVKDLIPGVSYKTKRDEDIVYVGRFHWYETSYRTNCRTGKKYHIFTSDDGKNFSQKTSLDFLSQANTVEPVQNYADIISKFQRNTHSSKIVAHELREKTFDFDDIIKKTEGDRYYRQENIFFCSVGNTGVKQRALRGECKYVYKPDRTGQYQFAGFSILDYYTFNFETQAVTYPNGRNTYYGQQTENYSPESLKALGMKFYDLYVTLENGKVIKVDDLRNI